MTETYCPECRTDRLFETPPCQDGHADCVDLMCVECGHATTSWSTILVDDAVLVDAGLVGAGQVASGLVSAA